MRRAIKARPGVRAAVISSMEKPIVETATRHPHPLIEDAYALLRDRELVPIAISVFCILPPEPDDRDRSSPDYVLHEQRMTDDIAARGVRQPIYVMRSADERFRALTGWTRTLASRRAGKATIPAFILDRPLKEAEQEMERLLENEMRHDFTPLERAPIYLRLMKLNGWSQGELAKRIHVSPAHVAKVLAISTKLSADVQALVVSGELSPRAAYALSRLADHGRQLEIANKAVSLPMSAETVEGLVDKELNGSRKSVPKPIKFSVCGVTGSIKGNPLDAFRALHGKLGEILKRVERDPALAEALPSLLKGV